MFKKMFTSNEKKDAAKGFADGLRGIPSIDEMHMIGRIESAAPTEGGFSGTIKITNDQLSKLTGVEEMPKVKLEEWIWVEGYKATDADMKCRDYQYMLGVQHDMPEGAKISECESGFHLCLKLEDVFKYYSIGENNRFFKVKACVRKDDFLAYGKSEKYDSPYSWIMATMSTKSKLAAKSIIFTQELTPDEILVSTEAAGWTDEDKKLVLEVGFEKAKKIRNVRDLELFGFSEEFAKYIVYNLKKYELASALASQPGLSMDTKAIILCCGEKPDSLKNIANSVYGGYTTFRAEPLRKDDIISAANEVTKS